MRRPPKSSLFYTVYEPWATTLPTTQYSPSELKNRYGYLCSLGGKGNDLEKVPANVPIKKELELLRSWSSTPIQLDRGCRSIGKDTWDDVVDVVSRFLGFGRRYHGVQESALSLRLLTNQGLLAEFLAFVWARSSNVTGMNNQVRGTQRSLSPLAADWALHHSGALAACALPRRHVPQLLCRVSVHAGSAALARAPDTPKPLAPPPIPILRLASSLLRTQIYKILRVVEYLQAHDVRGDESKVRTALPRRNGAAGQALRH